MPLFRRPPLSGLLPGLLLLASAACGPEPITAPEDATTTKGAGGIVAGDVAVSRVTGGIKLTNGTERPVAYAVWNRGWLALFAPCADTGPECLRLAPGASVTVPDSEIDGYAPGAREAVVRWWHVLPDGAGRYQAGAVQEVVVAL